MNFLCATLGSHIKTLCSKSIARHGFLTISFVNVQVTYKKWMYICPKVQA